MIDRKNAESVPAQRSDRSCNGIDPFCSRWPGCGCPDRWPAPHSEAEWDDFRQRLLEIEAADLNDIKQCMAERDAANAALRDAPTIYADHRDITEWRETHSTAIDAAMKAGK